MNILVISQYFWPENFRINDLVIEFSKRGHQVTVLTGIPNYPTGNVFPEYSKSPSDFVCFNGIDIVRVPMIARGQNKLSLVSNYISFSVSASVIGAWKLRRKSFDVIFTFEPSPITVGVPSSLFRKLKSAPHVFWVLDLWPNTLKAVGALKSEWMIGILEYVVRYVYKHCDLILVQSKRFENNVRKYAKKGQWIEYFPAWPEIVFDHDCNDLAPEISANDSCFTIVFAGNIGEAQDFPAILRAAQLLKFRNDIRWIIVGDGRKEDWLRREVKALGLEDSFVMLGRYPLDRMPEFFLHADALLVSLKSDPIFSMTIPGKMQSYFESGIPVLAMLDGEGADVVQNANAGLVCPAGDSEGLVDNVIRLISMDKEGRSKLGANGKELARVSFNKKVLIDQLDEWFFTLLK